MTDGEGFVVRNGQAVIGGKVMVVTESTEWDDDHNTAVYRLTPWADLIPRPELDSRLYTESELFCAGAMSTMPPFDKMHPTVCLPYARKMLEALGEWEPSDG